jgi:hypothetical protein
VFGPSPSGKKIKKSEARKLFRFHLSVAALHVAYVVSYTSLQTSRSMDTITAFAGKPGLSIAVCWRPVPARTGEEHAITKLARQQGNRVVQTPDSHLDLRALDVVLMLENCGWFPAILREFKAARKDALLPLLAVWHWEPLPLPKAAGVPTLRLNTREIAKVLMRDARATDVFTNLRNLRWLSREARPVLLVVSSQAWQESLAERGITAQWVPYGYEVGDGILAEGESEGERDIEALFLGSLEIPRRRKIVKELRGLGVNLEAQGSWFKKQLWGEDRARLINRAQAFLNIQRHPREIGAHRMILGMANHSLVLSEPIYKPAPFLPGKHYVEAEVREMPEVLRYYRAYPGERAAIVDRAYRFVTQELRMETSVSRILSLIQTMRCRVKAGS